MIWGGRSAGSRGSWESIVSPAKFPHAAFIHDVEAALTFCVLFQYAETALVQDIRFPESDLVQRIRPRAAGILEFSTHFMTVPAETIFRD